MSKKIKLSKKTVKAFNKFIRILIKRATTCDYADTANWVKQLDNTANIAEAFYSKRKY